MDPLALLQENLTERGDLTWTASSDAVRIEAPNAGGFPVALARSGAGWQVSLGEGFHEEFDDLSEAVNFLVWSLTPACRLREVRRGRWPEKCTVEAFEDGSWRPLLVTGFLVFPFWRPRTETVFQNQVTLRTV